MTGKSLPVGNNIINPKDMTLNLRDFFLHPSFFFLLSSTSRNWKMDGKGLQIIAFTYLFIHIPIHLWRFNNEKKSQNNIRNRSQTLVKRAAKRQE